MVELRRYASRRAVRASGTLVLLGIVVACVIVFVNSKNGADADAEVERQRAQFIQNCLEFQDFVPPDVQNKAEFCRDQSLQVVSDPRFRLDSLTDIFAGLSPLLIILALGLGATFIGAEWSAGTMTTYLTWEPRRTIAFLAKASGGVLFVFLAALAVQAVLGLLLTPVAMLRGTTQGVDAAWFGDTMVMALRSATLCAVLAGIGFALASVARNTAASLIVGFVYFAVLENMLRAFRPNWARWLLGENAALFLVGREQAGIAFDSSPTRAIVTLLAYVLILLSGALMVFRRRDVT
jgi:hypothetical protein